MTRTYERKYLEDGVTLNPKWKPDTRIGDRHKSSGDRHTDPHRNKKDTFIAIDGEGVTFPDGRHEYVFIAASSGESLTNPNGLSTKFCFDFLMELAEKYPKAIFVCFASSYDVNMMLRDIPQQKLLELWERKDAGVEDTRTTNVVVQQFGYHKQEYALTYIPRKSFIIRRFGDPKWLKNDEGVYKQNYDARMTLWDVFGFFQYSFVDALADKKIGYFHEYLQQKVIRGNIHEMIEWPDELTLELTHMKQMKRNRRHFSIDQLEEIEKYCRDEVQALEKLMYRLRDHLDEAGIQLARWNGAGSCASVILRREKVKDHLKEEIPDKALYDAQLRAYAGGRFEIGKYGAYKGKVYNYDLHSAYPSVMPLLPSLTNGMWRRIDGLSVKPYALVHIKWNFNDSRKFYPFFYRFPDGSIYFPCSGEGWYWKPEVESALRAWESGKLSSTRYKGSIECIESWEFEPYYDTKPFAFMTKLYDQRKEWEAIGNPAQKVMKFTINSTYGKLCQSIGGTSLHKPPYHNIGWSGYITSCIRAKLFDAMMQKPESVLMAVADGLYTTEPLDLPLGDHMGEWEEKQVDGIIIVQSGVYWSLKKMDRKPTKQQMMEEDFKSKYYQWGGDWYKTNAHYKGYDKGSLTVDKVMNGWKHPPKDLTIYATATRFVTLGSAFADPEEKWPLWRTWRPIERKLLLEPIGKRIVLEPNSAEPHKGLCETYARYPFDPQEKNIPPSTPFHLKWNDEDEEMYGFLDGIDKNIVEEELYESEI